MWCIYHTDSKPSPRLRQHHNTSHQPTTKQFLRKAPGDFEGRLERARALLGAGDARRAQHELRSLLSVAPGHPEVVEELAKALFACGAAAAALDALEAHAAFHPGATTLTHINMLAQVSTG